MEYATYLEQLAADVERMADVAGASDLNKHVPTCPGWDLRDLVQHLGGVHTWARTFVEEARTEPIRETLEEQVGGWPDDPVLVDWFRTGGRRLVAALATARADIAAWTFLEAPDARTHWARRQTHETAIHRVDAELGAGVEPLGFRADIASDGVDEVLMAFIARRRRGPRHSTPSALAVTCTDTGRSWTVSFDSETSTSTPGVSDDTDVVVSGPAAAIYRWVWNRLGDEGVEIVGDRSIARVWSDTVHVTW